MILRHASSAACLALIAALPAPAAEPAPDTRVPIVLTSAEREYVLAGMRGHIQEIQTVTSALASGDREGARAAALQGGTRHFATLTDHPPGLAEKWPAAWKQMLRARLASFDALAEGIGDGDSATQTMQRLSTVLQTCAACHAAYRLASGSEKP